MTSEKELLLIDILNHGVSTSENDSVSAFIERSYNVSELDSFRKFLVKIDSVEDIQNLFNYVFFIDDSFKHTIYFKNSKDIIFCFGSISFNSQSLEIIINKAYLFNDHQALLSLKITCDQISIVLTTNPTSDKNADLDFKEKCIQDISNIKSVLLNPQSLES